MARDIKAGQKWLAIYPGLPEREITLTELRKGMAASFRGSDGYVYWNDGLAYTSDSNIIAALAYQVKEDHDED